METVRILTAARPSTLKADVDLQDLSSKTSLEYFEERLAFLDLRERVELRKAFAELIEALNRSERCEEMNEVDVERLQVGIPTTDKFVTMRIAEVNEESSAMPEIFYDTVESF